MPLRRQLLGLAMLVGCNAILDNDPRELVTGSGGDHGISGAAPIAGGTANHPARGGSAGALGEGGSTAGGSDGEPGGDAGSGAPGTTGGSADGGESASGGNPGAAGAATGGASGSATGGTNGGGSGGSASCPGGCSLPHAQSACRDGACVITSCQAGFLDTNLDASDGCEAGDVPTSGLLLWFMGDRGLTLAGTSVSDWADQSPNHFHATQTGSAQMPKRVQPATGPAMVDFDGVDDALKLPSGFAAFNGTSFFAVANALPAETCAGILSFSNGPDIDDIEFGRHHTNLLYYEVVGEFVEGVTNAFEANRRLLVSIVQSTSGATQLRINGVVNASKTIKVPGNISRSQNFLGRDVYKECPQSYKGQLGEIILFNRAVSDGERLRIQNYLGGKWSVAVQ